MLAFMQYMLIVILSVIGAVAYGIVHDMFTAHMCVEYFTVAHPRLIPSDDPTTLALFWGVIATWWVGLPLGIALAICARIGDRPKVGIPHIIKPLGVMLLGLLAIAGLAWSMGYCSGKLGLFRLMPPWDTKIPIVKHNVFLGDVWSHLASYFFGVLGGILLCVYISKSRTKVKAN